MLGRQSPEHSAPVVDWQAELVRDLVRATGGASGWGRPDNGGKRSTQLHLAVLIEPFLEFILERRKTIESRFSVNKVAPYGVVRPGDQLALKRSSGPVVGICRVHRAAFFEVDSTVLEQLRADYAPALCAEEPSFWKARARARYATVLHLADVAQLNPLPCAKRDRRGWVVLPSPVDSL